VRLREIAKLIDAECIGDPDYPIEGLASVDYAGPDQICYAESAKLAGQVEQAGAGATVVGPDFPELAGRNLLRVEKPKLAFLRIMESFAEVPACDGVHPQAYVAETAQLGEQVSIGPNATVLGDSRIGNRSRIEGGAYIGKGVTIGEDCRIEANATLLDGVSLGDRCIIHAGAVIGGDGFGFEWLGDHHHKVPQLGSVAIEDDVEIGCNACVDRATLGETRVGAGSKLDNLVQVAHNDTLGRHVIMAGQSGLAGSVTLGNGVVIAGQAAVSDHVTLGDGVQVGGQAGVTQDSDPAEKLWGTPARPIRRVFKEQAATARLPELIRTVKAQEKELAKLRRRLDELSGQAENK